MIENHFFVPIKYAHTTKFVLEDILDHIKEGGNVKWIATWIKWHDVSLPREIVEMKKETVGQQRAAFCAVGEYIEKVLPECIEILEKKRLTFDLIEKFQLFTSFLVNAHYKVHRKKVQDTIIHYQEIVLLSQDYAYLISTALESIIASLRGKRYTLKKEDRHRMKNEYYYDVQTVFLYYIKRNEYYRKNHQAKKNKVKEETEGLHKNLEKSIDYQKHLIKDLDLLLYDLRKMYVRYDLDANAVILTESVVRNLVASN